MDHTNVTAPALDVQSLLEKYFLATMTDVSSRPLTASRRAAAARTVQRLEVLSSTSPGKLLKQIAAWAQVPPVAKDPLSTPTEWVNNDRTPATSLKAFTDSTNQGAVIVRTGSMEVVTASVSQGTLSMLVNDKRVASKSIPVETEHTLKVVVSGSTTTATVDGGTKISWTSKLAGPDLTGGIGIRVGINRAKAAWPAFTSLGVAPTKGTITKTGAQSAADEQQVSDSVLLDPAATWLSAPGVKAPFKVGHSGVEPENGGNLSAYGAYEPDATDAWSDYTVTGTVSRLTTGGVSGAVWVRVGSALAISVQVSQNQLQVFSGNSDEQELVGERTLTMNSSHKVTVAVSAYSTVISVDGIVRMTLLAKGETGGVAYSAYRDLTRRTWPDLTDASVVPGTQGATG
jgi:biofilm PGA synthesis lipoprotein PgaB